jgi:uncharacterized protein YrrD
MIKASDVVGRPVTARDAGQDLGNVKDIVVDATGRDVIGVILSDRPFLGARVAPWSAVQALGPDSLVIDAAKSVVKGSVVPGIKEELAKKTKIRGLKLLTTKGKELGKIIDIEFDETTGEVSGYELSSGVFSDTFEGTPFLPTPKWIELGKDVAFVTPEVEPTIKPAAGGIKAVFRRGDKGEKAGVATGTAAAGLPGMAPSDRGPDGAEAAGPSSGDSSQ